MDNPTVSRPSLLADESCTFRTSGSALTLPNDMLAKLLSKVLS